MVACLF